MHDAVCLFCFLFPSVNGKKRSTAASKEVGECAEDDDQRKAQSHCAEGGCAAARDTGDIDTVYDVIEQVQNLGNQHGEGCSENVSGHGSIFKINSFHKSGTSFSFVFVFQYNKLRRESKFRVIGSRPESLTTRNKI